jgi:hypothetical protein
VFGEVIDVTDLDREGIKARRERLGLSKAETARRMLDHTASEGWGTSASGEIARSGQGMGAATESACQRAISDLENGKRYLKEAQYVDALLAVLGLKREDVGL